MLLSRNSLDILKGKKNLLAFSAGIDSSALFFLIKQEKIEFDIALVNYHTRESSCKEAERARELAKRFNKKAYIKETLLSGSNFEHEARKIRYAFFEEIIKRYGYDNLITAHHLNDRLEWFLMQFTKGAGAVELLGFDEIEEREFYTLVRPLIWSEKRAICEYLEQNDILFFLDESNSDEKYRRNYFRKNFSDKLLDEFKEGIKKSFLYLHEDKNSLFDMDIEKRVENLFILKRAKNEKMDIRRIDRILKRLGYILSAAQKNEILRQKDTVIGDRFSIVIEDEKIFIAPFIRKRMPKEFKERCRKKKIPSKIRPYLYSIDYDFT